MKKKVCFIALLFQIIIAQSQNTNFKAGYYVDVKGDTIKGLIENLKWDNNPNSIAFQGKDNSEIKMLKSTQIKMFQVENEIFVSAIVQKDNSPYQTDRLSFDDKMNASIDTVFLRAIILGVKNLYYLKDNKDKVHFFIQENDNFQWLIYRKFYKIQKDEKVVIENNQYKNQLRMYLSNNEAMSKNIEYTKYSITSLRHLFESFYKSKNLQKNYSYSPNKQKNEMGLMIGTNFTKTNYNPLNNNLNTTTKKVEIGIEPMLGVFYEFKLPSKLNQYSFYNELFYSTYRMKGEYFTESDVAGYYQSYKSNFLMSVGYIGLNNMFHYQKQLSNYSIFANIGIGNGLILHVTNNQKNTEINVNNVILKDSEKVLDELRRHEQKIILGLGAKYKRFGLELRGVVGNGFSPYNKGFYTYSIASILSVKI